MLKRTHWGFSKRNKNKRRNQNLSLPKLSKSKPYGNSDLENIMISSPNFRRRILVDLQNPSKPFPLGKSFSIVRRVMTFFRENNKTSKIYNVVKDSVR